MELSNVLKEKRKEHNYTQEQLAEKIFVSAKTISNWETGKTSPDIDSLIRLAKLFDLSLDHLLLEGSDLVRNIKKIEAAKTAQKYFWFSWSTHMIFVILLGVQRKISDGLPSIILLLVTLAVLTNSFVMFHFAKEVKMTNENQSPYQIIKQQNKWLLLPIVLVVLLFIWIVL